MWKKIKAFIPWIISIISTVFITKFFTRRKSSGNEYSRAATEIENELIRNRELTRKANDKINSISDRIGEDETRVKSIKLDFPILKLDLEELKTTQKELKSSTEKISESLTNYNKEPKETINNLQTQNDFLTVNMIFLITYLIYDHLSSP